jgi:allophanate hydrolase subunit 2
VWAAQSGVSYCGALDGPALHIANALVGNDGDARPEITLGQCEVQFNEATWFALTGAGCEAKLDGKAVWTGWRYPVRPGKSWY